MSDEKKDKLRPEVQILDVGHLPQSPDDLIIYTKNIDKRTVVSSVAEVHSLIPQDDPAFRVARDLFFYSATPFITLAPFEEREEREENYTVKFDDAEKMQAHIVQLEDEIKKMKAKHLDDIRLMTEREELLMEYEKENREWLCRIIMASNPGIGCQPESIGKNDIEATVKRLKHVHERWKFRRDQSKAWEYRFEAGAKILGEVVVWANARTKPKNDSDRGFELAQDMVLTLIDRLLPVGENSKWKCECGAETGKIWSYCCECGKDRKGWEDDQG